MANALALVAASSPASLANPAAATIDLDHPDPSLRLDAIPYDDSCHMFHCVICNVFTCDSIDQLSQHITLDRSSLRSDEVLMVIGGKYRCKLCSYDTPLKANFQLHCKTDKHLAKLSQVNHIKEGGPRNEYKIPYANISNPVLVRCNLCNYIANSVHKLQMHTTEPRHEASARVYSYLQLSETIVKVSGRESFESLGKSVYYYCSMCQLASKTKIGLVHHFVSAKHLQHENLRQLKMQQAASMANSPVPVKTLDEEIREMFQVKEYSPGDQINFADGE